MQVSDLNEEQQKLCDASGRVVVGLAGPGSGKTTTIVARCHAMPDAVAASTALLTFTTAASAELKRRIEGKKMFFVGTTHSFCLRALNIHGSSIGLGKNLSVLSQEASQDLIAEFIGLHRYTGDSDTVCEEIKRNPKIENNAKPLRSEQAFRVAMSYHQSLIESRMLDYDSILSYGLHLLKKGCAWIPEHLIVDESQDSNSMEWSIYKAINAKSNVFIGDLDQSIYEWREATPETLRGICEKYKQSVFTITHNHRSGLSICNAATKLIEFNRKRVNKKIVAALDIPSVIIHDSYKNRKSELDGLISRIKSNPTVDHAVLCRWNAGCGEVRKALSAEGIKIQGRSSKPDKLGFAMSMMAAHNDPSNDRIVFNYLKKKHGTKTAKDMQSKAISETKPLAAVHKNEFSLGWVSVSGLSVECVHPEENRIESFMSAVDIYDQFGNECAAYIEDVLDTISGGDSDPTIQDLLQALEEDVTSKKSEGVWVSTIHKSKGLEWDSVYLPIWIDESFPGRKMSEEERRLAFVAVTRAERAVFISSTEKASLWAGRDEVQTTPSRFIKELGIS